MDIKHRIAAIAAAGLLAGTGSGAVAQDVEMLSGGSTAQWRMFSESDATTYLVDMASILRNGDEASVRIARVSKPGRRVYAGSRELRPVLRGMGIRVMSTPAGIISDRAARTQKLGGEILCEVY